MELAMSSGGEKEKESGIKAGNVADGEFSEIEAALMGYVSLAAIQQPERRLIDGESFCAVEELCKLPTLAAETLHCEYHAGYILSLAQ